MDTYNGKSLTPLAEHEPLYPGDVVLIKFAWLIDGDWYRAYEWSAIEKKLAGRKDWRVVSYRNEGDFLWAEIEVLPQPPPELQQASLVQVVLITAAIIGGTVAYAVYALMKREQYLLERKKIDLVASGKAPPSILEPPASAVVQAATGFKALSYAALVAVGGYVFLRVFRR